MTNPVYATVKYPCNGTEQSFTLYQGASESNEDFADRVAAELKERLDEC